MVFKQHIFLLAFIARVIQIICNSAGIAANSANLNQASSFPFWRQSSWKSRLGGHGHAYTSLPCKQADRANPSLFFQALCNPLQTINVYHLHGIPISNKTRKPNCISIYDRASIVWYLPSWPSLIVSTI